MNEDKVIAPIYDLGHRGDVDETQIMHMLSMTPQERLRHHESWRLFVKEVSTRAKLLRENDSMSNSGKS